MKMRFLSEFVNTISEAKLPRKEVFFNDLKNQIRSRFSLTPHGELDLDSSLHFICIISIMLRSRYRGIHYECHDCPFVADCGISLKWVLTFVPTHGFSLNFAY